MAPNCPPIPAELAALCIDATWQCASDLRLDHLQPAHGSLSGDLVALRGRRLDDLAKKAVFPGQRDALLHCLDARRIIRDLTLSLVSRTDAVCNFMLNAVPRFDAKGAFLGYIGSLRLWEEVPFAEHRKGETIELLRQTDAALAKESRLRREADLLVAALQILIEPIALQEKCAKLFETIGPTLAFDQAVVLRRGLRAKFTVAGSSDAAFLGIEWPEKAVPAGVLAGDARLIAGEELEDMTRGVPKPLSTAKTALFAPLCIGSETAVLVAFGQNRDQFVAQHLSLMRRVSLIATKAFQDEDQKTALVASSKLAGMGELLATIAHEVNQPITIISMSAVNGRMLLEDGGEPRDIVAKLARIEEQARRAGDLIQAVRRMSYVDRVATRNEPVDLREALQTVEMIARIGLEKKDIALTVAVDESCAWVQGHASWLQQVVLNLITNARDAIVDRLAEQPNRGPGAIRLEVDQVGDSIVVRVADNGGGVPEDIQERIFDPYFTLKEMGKGNGLGLALCRRLISDMGGQITLHNDDLGAVFEIHLLAAVEPSAAPRVATG